jgi:two-component sensor histidine kinase
MTTNQNLNFFNGGGEMGALMRAFDWDNSPLGPTMRWPQSLRVTIRLMLNTRHPMFIWWGPELIQFYNDAYALTMGPERHPAALGGRGRECWAEIWDIIGPQIAYVMSGKGSTWDEDRLVPLTRHGHRENVWWTYSFAPIDLDGGVGGVLVVCNDVTEQHLTREALKLQTARFEQLFEQAPGFMAVLRGSDHVFELTNAAFRNLAGDRNFRGRSLRDAMPELEGQGFYELLDRVYQTGDAHIGNRVPIVLGSEHDGSTKQAVLDFLYQPILEPSGKVSGIFVQGTDVTDHVRTENHLRLVNDELKHRVKNTLAMVSAIAGQTLRGSEYDTVLETFTDRLSAFATAHDILTANAWATAATSDVVESALRPYRTGRGRFFIAGPNIILGSKQALSLSLALHELATNAMKYGSMSNENGTVHISWSRTESVDGPLFRFLWHEQHGPKVEPPSKQGFGSRLIERVLRADFGGTIVAHYETAGLKFELTAPFKNLGNVLSPNFHETE